MDKFEKELPLFQVGQKKRLIWRNIKTIQPCNKLNYQKSWPLLHTTTNQSNLLELPTLMKILPIFYISLLEPFKESNMLEKMQLPSPCIKIDNHEEYKVEKVFYSWSKRGKLKNLMHWHGYDINKYTWKVVINVFNSPQKVHKFF